MGPFWTTNGSVIAGKKAKPVIVRPDFAALFADIKQRIQSAQTRAVLAVNTELVRLYWDIGRIIDHRHRSEGWGAVVTRKSAAARGIRVLRAKSATTGGTITEFAFWAGRIARVSMGLRSCGWLVTVRAPTAAATCHADPIELRSMVRRD